LNITQDKVLHTKPWQGCQLGYKYKMTSLKSLSRTWPAGVLNKLLSRRRRLPGSAAVKLCRQTIHPLHAHLNPLPRSSAHHDTSLPEETLRSLSFCEHHISKLDLSRPKLLLIPFKPSLVVLDEEVASLSVREEGSTQLAVVTVSRNWPSHELLNSRPSWIRSRAARLEPVLALSVLVGQGHQGSAEDSV